MVDGPLQPDALAGGLSAVGGGPREERFYGDSNHRRACILTCRLSTRAGANEAGYPWEADYARINPAYFDAADLRIRYLVESGLTPCIVACWGYFLPIMGIPKIKKHWRYLDRALGSLSGGLVPGG